MNKKSMMKLGGVFLFLLIAVIVLFFISSSSAILQKKVYELGEKVKIDLQGSYRLKIKTPSTSFIREGKGSITFTPEEIGKYKIILEQEGNIESYEFEVVDENGKEVEKEIQAGESLGLNQSVENKDFFQENKNEVNPILTNSSGIENQKNQEETYQIVVGIPVRHKEILDVPEGSAKIRIKIPDESKNIVVSDGVNELDFDVKKDIQNTVKSIFSDDVRKDVILRNVGGSIELKYTTSAPEKQEKEISESKKEVIVSALIILIMKMFWLIAMLKRF